MIAGQQADAGFYFPEITSALNTGSDLNITIRNSTAINAPVLYYKPLFDIKWNNVTASGISADELNFTIPKEDLGSQEIYEYFFNGTESRYPNGNATIKIALTKGVSKYRRLAENISLADPENLCKPWANPHPWSGTQTCASEDNHAWIILGIKNAYASTQNNTYAQKLLNISFENITHITRPSISTCDHTKGDYNCESTNYTIGGLTGSDPVIDGSERQALMIYSMWQNYRNTKNITVKQIAESYTLGSAEDCDVWAGNYSCRTPDDVGLMALAYLEAWELTGNSTYFSKAISLSDKASTLALQDNTSMFLAIGLLKAWELTGNYTQHAAEQTNDLYDHCISNVCDSSNQAANLLLSKEAYRMTGEYKYLRATIALANKNNSIDCNPNTGDYSCTSPEEQGLTSTAFWGAYEVIPDETGFYFPNIISTPNLNNDLDMAVRIKGHLETPKMYFRLVNLTSPKLWDEYNISYDGSIFVPQENTGNQGVYEYFFNSSEGYRFPDGNGTFKIALSIGNNNFKNKARFFTETTSVSPNCDVWSNEYTCDDERQQAWMITGYTLGYLMEKNNAYKSIASNLTMSEIDIYKPSDETYYNYYATCDHNYTENDTEDFNCNTHDSLPFKKNITGADRQSSMISSLWLSFKKFDNWFFGYLAKGYTSGHADNCDVWLGDYNCDDPNDINNSNQGQMILAYWNAYESTGNATYRNIAKNLTSEGLSKNGSVTLVRGFWKAYEMTGNNTYRQKAINLTTSSMNDCINASCTSFDLATNIIAYWEAYEQNPTAEYLDMAFNKTSKVETSKCNAFGYNYSCENDLSQGAMIAAYWKAYQTYPTETGNIIVNITSKNTANILEAFNAAIYIENNNTYEITYIDIIIDLTPGLITENQTFNITSIAPYENTTLNITIIPIGIGPNTITAYADASKGAHGEISKNITLFTSDNIFQNTTAYLSDNEKKIGGEFYLLFEINNPFNYTLFNISFELALGSGLLVTNVTITPLTNFTNEMNNTLITIPSIEPNETLLLNFTLKSSNEGTNHIAFNVSTPYGGLFSDTLPVTITKDAPPANTEETSSSSFAEEETKENYTYGVVDIEEICEEYPQICEDLEEFLFKHNLEIDAKKTKEPDAWINVSRNATKDIALELTANANHTIIVYDVIPKKVANTSDDINVCMHEHYIVEKDPILRFIVENKELHALYEIDSNYDIYDFEKPYIYFTKPKELEFNITSLINDSLIMVTNVTINISSNYFDPVCKYSLDSNGWITFHGSKILTNLSDGKHLLEIMCFDKENKTLKKNMVFEINAKKTESFTPPISIKRKIPAQMLFAVVLALLVSLLVLKRMQKNTGYYDILEKELDHIMHLIKQKKYKEADLYLTKIISVYSRTRLPPRHEKKISSRIKDALAILKKELSVQQNNIDFEGTKKF